MFSLAFKHRGKSESERRSPSRRASAAEGSSSSNNNGPSQPQPPPPRTIARTRSRSQSHGSSLKSNALTRTFSNSLSKRLSFFSNNSSEDLNSLTSSHSELATQELTRFKTLNHDRFPKEVLEYLKFQGLSSPKILQESSTVRISVSASGENVFLPSLISLSEEEQQNLEQHSPNPINTSRPATVGPDVQSSSESQTDTSTTTQSSSSATVPTSTDEGTVLQENQQTQSHIDDSVDPIPHTFAVIITLQKPTAIINIKTQLQSICSIQWPRGLPSDRTIKKEEFELGQANWDLNISNHNYYVPLQPENAITDDDYGDDAEPYGSEGWDYDHIDPHTDQSKFLTEQKIPARKVELRSFDQVTRGGYINRKRDQDPFVLGALNGTSLQYPSGHYVFVLPTLFEPNLPETVLTTKSHVSYSLRTIVAQKGKTYSFGEHYVPIIRAPPVSGITTADKPIFVSKVWNDTLSYEISFPKKYVTLGTELPFKLKFIPMEKDVTVKRVKVNVIEKITYVSKSLEFEYDEHGTENDETAVYLQTNGNEKIVPLLEVRSKSRNSRAVREEVVEDAAVFDNLLSCCYQLEKPTDPNASESERLEIVGPLSISTHLPFIKPQKNIKLFPATSKQFLETVLNIDRTKPQASRELRTRISNQSYNVNTVTKINQPDEGLTPDSLNNRYINIDHKLQICVRISRKDPSDLKIHHYEVIIDTPIFVLNGACVPETVELPAYTDGNTPVQYYGDEHDILPTFDEAMSPMNSPMLIPTHEQTLDRLSRTSTINTNALDYDNIDGLMNDSSELSLGSYRYGISRRRSTSAKAEMLNTFKRTLSNTPALDDPLYQTGIVNGRRGSAGIRNSSSSSDGVIEEEGLPHSPPPYIESVALMSDESDMDEDEVENMLEVGSTSESIRGATTADQSTDLTEQFHRAVFGDYP